MLELWKCDENRQIWNEHITTGWYDAPLSEFSEALRRLEGWKAFSQEKNRLSLLSLSLSIPNIVCLESVKGVICWTESTFERREK